MRGMDQFLIGNLGSARQVRIKQQIGKKINKELMKKVSIQS
jgi:hypothetical protein